MTIEIRRMTPLLSVFDMPTSLKFYRDILGFQVREDTGQGDNSGWVFLEKSGVTLMLNTLYDDDERPAAPSPSQHAIHLDTCLYFWVPDPDAVYTFLKASGLELKPPELAYYGMKQVYLRDPDGYNLCFQSPVEG
jgi:catechol 2,3-dioxygenase-like lactoylglutathione lyase family enzyme